MPAQTAKQAHLLATKIQEARLAGDHDAADRLIKQFNDKVFGNSGQVESPGNHSNQSNKNVVGDPANPNQQLDNIQEQLTQLTQQYQQLLNQKQQVDPSTADVENAQSPENAPSTQSPPDNLPVMGSGNALVSPSAGINPAPANNQVAENKIPSLAEAVATMNQTGTTGPIAENTTQTNSVVQNVAESAPASNIADFKTMIVGYHDGVQSLLKQYLSDFSTELEIPEAVLAPALVREFENLWRRRQHAEPLLLKLPEYIQQRSVLLRFADQLKESLQ